MPKKKAGAKSATEIGQLNARVPETLLVRLAHYLADNRSLTQRGVVAEALDEYLKKRGS